MTNNGTVVTNTSSYTVTGLNGIDNYNVSINTSEERSSLITVYGK